MTTTDQSNMRKVKSDAMKTKREAFLAGCQAVPVTASDYASWLSAWIESGGSVAHFHDGPFKPYDNWKKPTVSTDMLIPTGYGAYSLNLLVTPRDVEIPFESTSGDRREGWEWGHTTVYTLYSSNYARTNQPYRAVCYIDDIPLLSDEAQEIVRGLQKGEVEKRTYKRSLPTPATPAVAPIKTPALEQANDTDTSAGVDTSTSSSEPEDDAYSLGRAVVDEINQRYGVDITLPAQAPLQQAVIALPQQTPAHNRKLWLMLAVALVVLLVLGGIFIL